MKFNKQIRCRQPPHEWPIPHNSTQICIFAKSVRNRTTKIFQFSRACPLSHHKLDAFRLHILIYSHVNVRKFPGDFKFIEYIAFQLLSTYKPKNMYVKNKNTAITRKARMLPGARLINTSSFSSFQCIVFCFGRRRTKINKIKRWKKTINQRSLVEPNVGPNDRIKREHTRLLSPCSIPMEGVTCEHYIYKFGVLYLGKCLFWIFGNFI